jgi:threonine/homoserine/homoserine lactone efflux protein
VLPLWAFVVITVPLVLTPGLSTAVVLRNSIAGGTRAGLETAIGVNAGSLCYGLLTALGFAVTVQRWPGAWAAVRGLGVLYLAWLGVQSIRRAAMSPGPRAPRVAFARRHGVRQNPLQNAGEGFLTNALNPAIATFYLILVPQFIPPGAPVVRSALALTAVHIALALSWHAVWAAAGGTLARAFDAGWPRRLLEALSGIALLWLATRVAVG